MRFRRSIKIAKGLRLNVSKSGLGFSVGGKGHSMSIGPRGTYFNAGISGTGLSFREKIGSNSKSYKSNNNSNDAGLNPSSFTVVISIDDETGKETITLEREDGTRIYNDESLLRKAKKTEAFKQKLEETRKRAQEQISQKTERLINIYQNSVELITMDYVKEHYNKLAPQKYIKNLFEKQHPTREELKKQLRIEAKNEIKSWKFWLLKGLRNQYVENHIEDLFIQEDKKWLDEKKSFEETENTEEIERNKKYFEDYKVEKENFEKIMSGDDNYIETTLEQVLSEIQLPLDFKINFQVHNSIVDVDLDLPEIEDYPQTKSVILQSGKLSVKKKTQTEINYDYAKSVFGLAFYFSSIIFNISPMIQIINIAGFTQRMSKRYGEIEDQYVYTIEFKRDIFSKLNIKNIEPLEAVDNFINKKDVTAKYELKTIKL